MKSPQQGFTLLELVIGIAILAVMAVIAATTLTTQGPKTELKSFARDLVSHMKLAQTNAIRDSKPWAIRFDPTNKNYQIISDSGEPWKSEVWDNGNETLSQTISLGTLINYGTSQGVPDASFVAPANGINFPDNLVIFKPNGTSVLGQVYFTVNGSETIALSVLSTTGRIKLWQNFGDGWQD